MFSAFALFFVPSFLLHLCTLVAAWFRAFTSHETATSVVLPVAMWVRGSGRGWSRPWQMGGFRRVRATAKEDVPYRHVGDLVVVACVMWA